jgi:hypothetical protein
VAAKPEQVVVARLLGCELLIKARNVCRKFFHRPPYWRLGYLAKVNIHLKEFRMATDIEKYGI